MTIIDYLLEILLLLDLILNLFNLFFILSLYELLISCHLDDSFDQLYTIVGLSW